MSNINIVGKIGFSWLQDSRLIGLKKRRNNFGSPSFICGLVVIFAKWLLLLRPEMMSAVLFLC